MKIAVVIPCYKVKSTILAVINKIEPEVSRIYVVDDCCPQKSGEHVSSSCTDTRVKILNHTKNLGVGGAVITGYKEALSEEMDIVVKVDGDDQMDPKEIPFLIEPIINQDADYTKGNRFFHLTPLIETMPTVRLFGNAVLSFVNKVSSGYWDIMDPTNGFTAIHVKVLKWLPLDKISNRYFFESDMLFRLGTIRAVVKDMPLCPVYHEDGGSSLSVFNTAFSFPLLYLRSLLKRFFYSYFLRDFNAGTLFIVLGLFLCIFGTLFGGYHWISSIQNETTATTGTVMLAALPFILGFNLLIAFVMYDMSRVPQKILNKFIR